MDGMDWINLAQKRGWLQTPVNAVMNLWFPQNAGNFLSSWGPINFSRTLLHGISYYIAKTKNTSI